MKLKVEAVANITVIIVALVVGAVVLRGGMLSRHTEPSVAAGDRLAAVPGIDWGQHRKTLVLALNTGCHYCQDSVPFYQKLAQAQPDYSNLAIVAAFPNDAQEVGHFAAQEAVGIRSVAAVPFDKWRVTGTPTLLLVDAHGRVERTWVGLLTSRQELDLMAMISGAGKNQAPDHIKENEQ
jgi:thiol-disulfide isomerase/thioredoxin